MSISDDIARLHALHQAGALNDSEFAQLKARVLAQRPEDDWVAQVNLFRRSKRDRWLGGVCGGIARATGLESWIWRLLFIAMTPYFGATVILYILACIFIPEEE